MISLLLDVLFVVMSNIAVTFLRNDFAMLSYISIWGRSQHLSSQLYCHGMFYMVVSWRINTVCIFLILLI